MIFVRQSIETIQGFQVKKKFSCVRKMDELACNNNEPAHCPINTLAFSLKRYFSSAKKKDDLACSNNPNACTCAPR